MKMNFTFGTGRNLSCDEVASRARVAEETGFTHITFNDQPNLDRDVHVGMTVAALNTHHIRIGQGVTDPYTFRPWVIANATATINELSGGRAFVGIGASGTWGGKMRKPLPIQELREAIQFIRKYMAGEEAEFKGMRMHSEWVRQPVPIYMGSEGPKSCQLAGELADGVMVVGINPEKVKWQMELIEKGALRAGRDPSKIDIWCRTMCYVAESKEAARREAASYTATTACSLYMSTFQRGDPEVIDLRQRLERAEPGIIDEFKRVHDVYDPYQTETLGAPHDQAVTQRVIDFSHLTGTPEDICEQIYKLGQLGIRTISVVDFTVIDSKGMMQEIGSKIMPHFRS